VNGRVVIESPLTGDTVRNFRFLLWCLRAVWLVDRVHGIASHQLNPWYMDDADPDERQAGIDNPWAWQLDTPHWFCVDLGVSGGMEAAMKRCTKLQIPQLDRLLATYHPPSWEAFKRGEWPPHTQGFALDGRFDLAVRDK
jgi:hypothetical protein